MRERSEMVVMEENNGGKCFPAGWRAVAAKPCGSCGTAPALLFCSFDKAFMCLGCDAKVHAPPSRHERVWMCEVCEMAPASVTCKADAAALCVACDRDIHSANPLARRHERIPVVPFYGAPDESVAKSVAADGEVPPEATWILSNPNPPKLSADNPDTKLIEFLLSDSDHFLDFDFPIPTDTRLQNHNHNSATDGVVPVQTAKPIPPQQITHHSPENRFEIDFTRSNLNSFNSIHTAQSLSQSVSSSSMDVGIVPDGSSMSDISYPFGLQLNSNFDPSNSTTANQGSQLSSSDRKARVMRYREKRKNRKFEKTIRYASRKAYAETRPRIKGRFAKRTETDAEVDEDRWFHGYGVVPSF